MSSNKSNINDASYGELLVSRLICNEYELDRDYNEELTRVSDLVKKSHPMEHKERFAVQDNRVADAMPVLYNKLNNIISNRGLAVVDARWVGGRRGARVSDLDIEFSDGYVLPLSLKSGGENTERNLGPRSLNRICGIDLKSEKSLLFTSAKRIYSKHFPEVEVKSISSIKKSIKAGKSNTRVEKRLMHNGYKVLNKVSTKLLNELSALSFEKKIELVKFISGYTSTDNNLEILVMSEEGSYFKSKLNLENISDISFGKLKDDSTTILVYLNRKPTYKININNTNGVGISSFALRVFRYNNPVSIGN